MKRLFLLLLVLLPCAGVAAQPGELFLPAGRRPVQFSLSAAYQRFERDGQPIRQASFPFALAAPLGANATMSLLAGGALAGGDGLASLSGLADVQVGLNYRQRIGAGSAVVNLGASLPSGKRELTPEQFQTSILLSQNFYSFRLPTLGQGVIVSPGVTVAFPVGDVVALGVGVSYQRKAAFRPIQSVETEYDPGDEVVLTGGVDVRLGEAQALSGDVTYTRYGADRLDGADYYEAGNRVAVTAQFLRYWRYNELRFLVRYSTRGRGTLPAADGTFVTEEERIVPNQGRVRLSYRMRTTPAMHFGLLVQGRTYEETAAFSAKHLLDLGVLPELRTSDRTSITTRFVYTLGSFAGLEAGAGLTVTL